MRKEENHNIRTNNKKYPTKVSNDNALYIVFDIEMTLFSKEKSDIGA
jgi:hypothetical protein